MKDLITERLKLKDIYPERAEALAKESGINIDDLELIRKGIVAEKAQVNKEERSVTSYINTAAKDRDNEVIEPKGVLLSHYRKNPVVPYGHNYGGLPVAKNIWIKKDDKGLLAKTVFLKHAFAEDVFQLYSESVAGTGPAMKAWSIGFIPLKWVDSTQEERVAPKEGKGEKDTGVRRTYKKWELLEYSAVMIPSNPEALTLMVEKGLIKSEKLRKEIEKYIEIEDEELEIEDIPSQEEDLLSIKAKPMEDYEYLLHHIETDDEGEEEIHHCLVYDHIANLFEQAHLLVKEGKVYLDNKQIKEGLFHVIKGLESTQETVWSDEEANENKIVPKKMKAGMTLKEKAKEW